MPKDNSKPQRERRAREAQERQAERAKRTDLAQQYEVLDARPGASKRERDRLTRKVSQERG